LHNIKRFRVTSLLIQGVSQDIEEVGEGGRDAGKHYLFFFEEKLDNLRLKKTLKNM